MRVVESRVIVRSEEVVSGREERSGGYNRSLELEASDAGPKTGNGRIGEVGEDNSRGRDLGRESRED